MYICLLQRGYIVCNRVKGGVSVSGQGHRALRFFKGWGFVCFEGGLSLRLILILLGRKKINIELVIKRNKIEPKNCIEIVKKCTDTQNRDQEKFKK